MRKANLIEEMERRFVLKDGILYLKKVHNTPKPTKLQISQNKVKANLNEGLPMIQKLDSKIKAPIKKELSQNVDDYEERIENLTKLKDLFDKDPKLSDEYFYLITDFDSRIFQLEDGLKPGDKDVIWLLGDIERLLTGLEQNSAFKRCKNKDKILRLLKSNW